jgi:hypothetical protein
VPSSKFIAPVIYIFGIACTYSFPEVDEFHIAIINAPPFWSILQNFIQATMLVA